MSPHQAEIAIAESPGPRAAAPGAMSLPEAQETVRAIWKSVLGSETIGDEDDFFELGGTSLSLIAVVQQMSVRFGADLPTGIVADGATVTALARRALEEIASAK